MGSRTEYHRQYQLNRRLERLAMAKERLGGKCSYPGCEITEDLEFDHIVPGSRTRKISEATNWSLERFLAEVDICQLFCSGHHHQKSAECGEVAHGEANGRAKLTEQDVLAIRESSWSYSRLAMRYGVSKTVITKIKTGVYWKHVGGPIENRSRGRYWTVEHGGGLTGKGGCKCDLCRARKNEYMRNWKKQRRQGLDNDEAA